MWSYEGQQVLRSHCLRPTPPTIPPPCCVQAAIFARLHASGRPERSSLTPRLSVPHPAVPTGDAGPYLGSEPQPLLSFNAPSTMPADKSGIKPPQVPLTNSLFSEGLGQQHQKQQQNQSQQQQQQLHGVQGDGASHARPPGLSDRSRHGRSASVGVALPSFALGWLSTQLHPEVGGKGTETPG